MSKKIVLFGGSFNPPHAGHFEIAKRVGRRRGVDEVWVLPVYRHPFGKKMEPFEDRLRLCRQHFRLLAPKVKVKDLERRLGGVSWTIRTLRHLRQQHPTWKFSIILGADTYRQRKSWKDFEAIRQMADLIVFPRGPRSPIPDISSTKIRATFLETCR